MRNRGSYAAVATGLVLAAAVVMTVVAIDAASNRSQPVRLTRREARMLSRLAVLRRPQRAADRSVRFVGPIVPSLTRLVATMPGNWGLGPVRVFMLVRRHGRVALLTLYGRHRVGVGGVSTANLNNPRSVSSGLLYTVGVVPDGVAEVSWVFRSQPAAAVAPLTVTIHPMVHNNVAVAPVVTRPGRLVSATWFNAGGRAISR